jgi:hypothetical protein
MYNLTVCMLLNEHMYNRQIDIRPHCHTYPEKDFSGCRRLLHIELVFEICINDSMHLCPYLVLHITSIIDDECEKTYGGHINCTMNTYVYIYI